MLSIKSDVFARTHTHTVDAHVGKNTHTCTGHKKAAIVRASLVPSIFPNGPPLGVCVTLRARRQAE